MRRHRVIVISFVIAALAATAAGLYVLAGRTDPGRICNGIASEFGGCDPSQPTFSATDCAGVGREAGRQVETRQAAIIDGPAVVNGESRAVRLRHALILVVQRANQYLRNAGIIQECSSERFAEAADGVLSDEFKARAGLYLFDDGEPHSYQEWLDGLRHAAAVIDQEKDIPYAGSTTP